MEISVSFQDDEYTSYDGKLPIGGSEWGSDYVSCMGGEIYYDR